MTPTPTLPVPPPNTATPKTPEWLYVEIMRHIEPDLLPSRLPLLDKWYATETPEERAERMAAYDRAFALFDKVYADVNAMLAREAAKLRTRASARTRGAEDEERGKEAGSIGAIIDSHLANP